MGSLSPPSVLSWTSWSRSIAQSQVAYLRYAEKGSWCRYALYHAPGHAESSCCKSAREHHALAVPHCHTAQVKPGDNTQVHICNTPSRLCSPPRNVYVTRV